MPCGPWEGVRRKKSPRPFPRGARSNPQNVFPYKACLREPCEGGVHVPGPILCALCLAILFTRSFMVTKFTARLLCDFLLLCLGFWQRCLQSSFDVVRLRVFLRWGGQHSKKLGTVPFANPASTYFALLILTSALAHQLPLFRKSKSISTFLFYAA